MRFLVMHKMNAELEKGEPPPPEIIRGVGELIGEAAREGTFLGGEGLRPSRERIHVAYRGGRRTVTPGPFADPRELPAGFALLKVRSRDEALGWLDRFAEIAGDVDLILGAVVEPWHLGMSRRPPDPPLRFLSLHRDPRGESEAPPDPRTAARMAALIEEMTAAGVLQGAGTLAPTRKGARIRVEGGKKRVIDGPFTESKELVAGYAMLELPSKDAAIEWAKRFLDVVRVDEVEVREMA